MLTRRSWLAKSLLAIGLAQLTSLAGLAAPTRTVVGTVYYEGGEPARNAGVQLEDQITLQVISQVTNGEGRYHFTGLNPDRDYKVKATRNGFWSKAETVSRFSSKQEIRIDLNLKPGKEQK